MAIQEDLIEGSSVATEGNVTRAVRVFHVDGIVVNPDQPYEALWQAQNTPGIPTINSAHPSRPALIARGIEVIGTSGTSAKLMVRYDSNEWGGPPSSYIITDDAYTEKYQTTFVPGTRQLISVDAEIEVNVPVDVGDGIISQQPKKEYIDPEPVPFVFDRSVRVISIRALIYGSLIADNNGFNGPYSTGQPQIGQKYVNHVNHTDWMGLPRGYWKIQRFRTDVAKWSEYYTKEINSITKNDEDWSEFGILRNIKTGKLVKPDEAALSTVAALPYEFGIIGLNQSNLKGFRRVGPCKTTDFRPIFGF